MLMGHKSEVLCISKVEAFLTNGSVAFAHRNICLKALYMRVEIEAASLSSFQQIYGSSVLPYSREVAYAAEVV